MSKTDQQPVSRVAWVPRRQLRANAYNPNAVAPPELDLLKLSILEDGWTQPIVVLPDSTIVDGFHRWTVSADPALRALTDGLVPVVVVDADPVHRMMSTIRHNRARGTHAVLRMAEIVRAMVEAGMAAGEVCRRLGMEDEELERLLDRSGMTVRGTSGAQTFGRAWQPSRDT
jgi:ParB-like chromosome segregation protein Spo0J